MAEIIGSRLEQLIKDRGTSQSKLGAAVGLSQPSIGRLVSGETRETGKLLEIASFLRTTPEFLVGESDEPGLSELQERRQPYRAEASSRADLVEVAEIDLRYGLGATYVEAHVEASTRSFSRAWLRNFTDSAPDLLVWSKGQGDSMMPTILDNDVVLIDRGQITPVMSDQIWAFAFGQVGMIKRLRPMPDGSVKILSDNPSVPADTAVDDELHIVGRVVAIVRKV